MPKYLIFFLSHPISLTSTSNGYLVSSLINSQNLPINLSTIFLIPFYSSLFLPLQIVLTLFLFTFKIALTHVFHVTGPTSFTPTFHTPPTAHPLLCH